MDEPKAISMPKPAELIPSSFLPQRVFHQIAAGMRMVYKHTPQKDSPFAALGLDPRNAPAFGQALFDLAKRICLKYYLRGDEPGDEPDPEVVQALTDLRYEHAKVPAPSRIQLYKTLNWYISNCFDPDEPLSKVFWEMRAPLAIAIVEGSASYARAETPFFDEPIKSHLKTLESLKDDL